tara:strand:- start:4861 stop:5286 length:426 start_codon:yes stop_codon:yes gene_type:complete
MLDTVDGTGVNLAEAGDDVRAALVMTNTTADTEEETALMNAFTTLDETAGSGYVRKALANQAVAIDTTNDRIEFDFDDITWSSLGNGARDLQGMLLLKHVNDDTDSIPIAFIEFSANQSPGGSDFTVSIDAEGAIHIKQGA